MRFYNWCFTLHEDEDHELLEPRIDQENNFKFCVYQLEMCESTGRAHYQGYIEMTEKLSMNQLKTEVFFTNRIHLEPRLGTQAQAIAYCIKKDTRLETPTYLGTPKKPGTRSDLDSMVDAIENGMTAKEILLLFRGNGLRHMGVVNRALRIFHERDMMDLIIMANRIGETELIQDLVKINKGEAEFNNLVDV